MTSATLTTATPAYAVPTGRRAAWHAFGALLLRDLRVLRRNLKSFLLRTVMQPLLFVFVFLYVFPKIGQGVGGPSGGAAAKAGPSFGDVLVPGLLAVAIIFQGIQAVALPLVQEFSFTREIEDRVLAPLPVWAVGLGKIVNGALQAMIAAMVVFPLVRYIHAEDEKVSVSLSRPHIFLAVLTLAGLMGACLGLLIGTSFAPQQVPLIFSIVVLPITMLGCIYYPWGALDPIKWLKYAVLINPLVYMSEGMRYALTPDIPHMPTLAIFGAMIFAVALMGGTALHKFTGRVVT
jgi:ABC-2 type transport system permease protein